MPANGATDKGRIVYPKAKIAVDGQRGGADGETQPKASQVANLNGKTQVAHKSPTYGESKPELAENAAAERQNSEGTTSEEQRKRLAMKMYPSSTGLRVYMPKFF